MHGIARSMDRYRVSNFLEERRVNNRQNRFANLSHWLCYASIMLDVDGQSSLIAHPSLPL
jgi:hypothetical protein